MVSWAEYLSLPDCAMRAKCSVEMYKSTRQLANGVKDRRMHMRLRLV